MFACDLCGGKFRKESKLRWHFLETRCDECDLTWKCENEYNIHCNQHPFKCDLCKATFAKESTLKQAGAELGQAQP